MNSTQRLDEFNRENLETNPYALIPVHVSWDEVESLNIMQGGQSVDETTGLREYSKLSEVLEVPEMRDVFVNVCNLIFSGEPIPDDIKHVMDTPIEQEQHKPERIKTDSDPRFVAMDKTGQGKDKIIVMMPQDVVQLMDSLQGGEKKDPALGLQEFGMFGGFGKSFGNALKSVVRVGATVAGAYLGGPLGAAAGNMAGRFVTGQKPGMDMLVAGAKNGLYAWGAGKALGAMGGSFGAMGSQAPGAWGMSNVQAGAPVVDGATGAPHVFGQGAAASSVPAAAAASPSILSGLGSYLPAAALAGAGLFMGHKGSKEREKEDLEHYHKVAAEKELRKRNQRRRANPVNEHDMFEGYEMPYQEPLNIPHGNRYKTGGSVSGYDKSIREIFGKFYNNGKSISLPVFKKMLMEKGIDMPKEDMSSLYHHYDRKLEEEAMTPESRAYQKNMKKYKTGGQVVGIEIKGRGTGQSDDIPKTVPENSWVWDATTVSHAGDGTTNAGQKAIKKFEDILKREKLPKHKSVIETLIKEKPLRKVPCALSNGERVTPPHLVAAAGDGDFDKGSAVLRKMTQELRRHKASKGLDLPPSAHDLTLYYKKAIKGA